MKKIIIIIIFILSIILFFGIFSLISVYGEPYFLPCSQFLLESELGDWKNLHANDISNLEGLLNQRGFIEYDTITCPGKVGIIIYYNGKSERKIIRNIVGNFFYFRGVPYTLKNI